MSIQALLKAIKVGEDFDWEFKSARGGLPRSLWESYAAMANTDGGSIVLGVEDDGFVSGLPDAQKMQTDFWNTINNQGHVSINLLTDQCVRVESIESKEILVIEVPRADRRQRPVFLKQNPLTGTYRRNYEGDYHCSAQEVRRMLADQSEIPADSQVLQGFDIGDLNEASLNKYRNLFSAVKPQHPWLELDTTGLLLKLGGWRTEKSSGVTGLTVAGLLMFGKDEAIRDPDAIPQYHIDYREKHSDDPDVRWTDRITIDGTWVGNLYEFYQRVIGRLTADLKVPFQMQPELFRKDDTIVHEAVRESLVNALIHADFSGQGGVIIENYGHRFEMSNPGTLLLSREQLRAGGVSECRNKSLQKMFEMIGGGEKLGSGIDKIWRGWKSQHWRLPQIKETNQPDRVKLVLPMASLLPEESIEKLQASFGSAFKALSEQERLAVVTADVEGSVSNSRLQEICDLHPSDITQILQGLCKGFLDQKGRKRGAYYILKPVPSSPHKGTNSSESNPNTPESDPNSPESDPNSAYLGSSSPNKGSKSPINDSNSTHKSSNSTHKSLKSPINDSNSTHKGSSSTHKGSSSTHNEQASIHPAATHFSEKMRTIAEPATNSQRLNKSTMKEIIIALCSLQYLSGSDLGELLNRKPTSLQQFYLRDMVNSGELTLRFPDEPNHPKQAYGRPSLETTEEG